MRSLLKYSSFAAAGALAMGIAASEPAKALDLVVVSWGGAYTASQQKAYHEPYMALNPDIKILNEDSAAEGLAKLRAQQETGNVTWDLVDMIASESIIACDEGLVLEIDPDKDLAPAPDGTPASEDFFEGMLNPGGSNCFIPQIVYSTTFGYRTDAFGGNNPTQIGDVFDLANFPGKRSLQKDVYGNFEWSLIADGVDADTVYDVLSTPEGVDQAFAKLATVKDQTIWWTKGAQPPQLLADGEVVIASGYNGRLFSVIEEEKQPVAMMWDWQLFDLDGWVVPAGGKNVDEVMKFLYFATDTQRLADQAKYISYGPARKSSAPLVGKHAELGIDMAPHMPTDPANAKTTLLLNYVWWADHVTEMRERLQAFLAQ
ncbi:MAG: extracellular solute-binding protein [Kiloniellales bacterium]|nr:extracellular solute-binding protein [Kiloniellales bacterium]